MKWHACRIGFIALVAAGLACDWESESVTAPPIPGDLVEHVTPQVLSLLAENDWLFPAQGRSSPGSGRAISAREAEALAIAYAGTFGRHLQTAWEQEHGASIDLASLDVATETLLAQSPYTALPGNIHPGIANAFGDYFIVLLGSGGHAQVLVAVSASATEVEIDERGYLQLPALGGSEFVTRGLPPQRSFRYLSPEAAAMSVAAATGARVSAVPKLILMASDRILDPAWQITLDRQVSVTGPPGANPQERTGVVYLSLRPQLGFMVAQKGAPTTARFPFVEAAANPRTGSVGSVDLRPGFATKFVSNVQFAGGK